MDKHRPHHQWLPLTAIMAVGVAMPAPALATQYFNAEQVQKLLFKDARQFVKHSLVLTPEQKSFIANASPTRTPLPEQFIWEARDDGKLLGWVVIDQVFGKHEFITYATALNPDGTVRQVEVMEYRETYGYEIRDPKWRAQFTGKKHGDTLKIDEDIKNIGGATLSCVHVSDGVKRVLALYQAALRKG